MSKGRLLPTLIVAALSLGSTTARAASQVTCVGDSITAGAGSSDPATKAYPAQLGGLLGANYTVENDGHSGATLLTTGDLPYTSQTEYTRSTNTVLANGGDVVIMLGTNDTKPQNWAHKATFESDCEALVAHYLTPADAGAQPPRVWLNLPSPDWPAGTPPTNQYGIDGQILKNETIPLLMQCAQNKGISTIDVYSALLSYQADFSDGVHPNDDGAGKIAQAVHDALVKLPTISVSATATSFPVGSPVVVNTTPTAAYGKVESVSIYEGTNIVGTSTTAPFTVSVVGLAAGNHALFGRVTETGGRTADSSPAITVMVVAPAVGESSGTMGTSPGVDAGPDASPDSFGAGGNGSSSSSSSGGTDASAKPDGGCNVARGEGLAGLGVILGLLVFLRQKLRPRGNE